MNLSQIFRASHATPAPAAKAATRATFSLGSSAYALENTGYATTTAIVTDQMCRWFSRAHAMARVSISRVSGRLLVVTGIALTTTAAPRSTKSALAQLPPPFTGTNVTQTAGTIASGGAYQTALAANPNRKGCRIYNKSGHTMNVYVGALVDATDAKSVPVAATTGVFDCGTGPIIMMGNINVTTSTTSDAFVVMAME